AVRQAIEKGVAVSEERAISELYGEIDRLAAEHQPALVEMRRDIHAHPELSNREERTAAVVADHLRKLGIDEAGTGIAGHGVVGVLRGGLPGDRVIALRADRDALPVKETADVEFASLGRASCGSGSRVCRCMARPRGSALTRCLRRPTSSAVPAS